MRKLILYGVIIIQIAIIVSLIRGIQLSKRAAGRIAYLQETKDKLLEEKAKLEAEGQYVESNFYLEKVARDELHLSKPGETVVILPDERQVVVADSETTVDQGTSELPNWKKWVNVFFGNE